MKKIPYEYMLYFLQLTLVSLFVLVLLAFNLDIEATNFWRRGMISQHAIGFELFRTTGDVEHEQIEVDGNTVLFKDLLDSNRQIVRGYYASNDVLNFSDWVDEGRFFNTIDFENNEPVAVIGYRQLENTIEENGQRYIGFDQNRFQVIGIFRETGSDLDQVVYLNLTYLWSGGTLEGRYFLDGQSEMVVDRAMDRISSHLANQFQITPIVYRDGHEFIMAPFQEMLLNIGFIAAVANLLMTTISFVSRQKYKVAIWKLCGMTKINLAVMYVKHLLSINVLAVLSVWLLQQLFGGNQNSILYLERLTWQHYGVMNLLMFCISGIVIFIVVKSADGVDISDTLKGM